MGFFENSHSLNQVGLLEANSYPLLVRAERITFVRGRREAGEIRHVMFTSGGRSTFCNGGAGRDKVHPYYKMRLSHASMVRLERPLVSLSFRAGLPRRVGRWAGRQDVMALE